MRIEQGSSAIESVGMIESFVILRPVWSSLRFMRRRSFILGTFVVDEMAVRPGDMESVAFWVKGYSIQVWITALTYKVGAQGTKF